MNESEQIESLYNNAYEKRINAISSSVVTFALSAMYIKLGMINGVDYQIGTVEYLTEVGYLGITGGFLAHALDSAIKSIQLSNRASNLELTHGAEAFVDTHKSAPPNLFPANSTSTHPKSAQKSQSEELGFDVWKP